MSEPAMMDPTVRQRRLSDFTRQLTCAMASEAWARDVAERLIAYDPLANEIRGCLFDVGNRITVLYRCDVVSRRQHTFVTPCWTKPNEG